jgi:hypothetical protein
MDLPNDEALRWIVATYASLRGAHGDGIGTPALVQPTVEFFPEAFHHDAAGVAAILRAMIGHAPIADDLPIELAFLDSTHASGGGCGTGACDPASSGAVKTRGVQETNGVYRVVLETAQLQHLDVLAATLARSVGSLVLHEVAEDAAAARSEITAIACGFGVILANGAAVWGKSCGGLRMMRATALSVEETTVGLALFVSLHGQKASHARKYLGTTQREAFDGACDWVESNAELARWLRESPSTLVAPAIEIEPVRGVLGNWLQRRKFKKVPASAPKTAPSDEKRRRLEEARALVDEVLGRD